MSLGLAPKTVNPMRIQTSSQYFHPIIFQSTSFVGLASLNLYIYSFLRAYNGKANLNSNFRYMINFPSTLVANSDYLSDRMNL